MQAIAIGVRLVASSHKKLPLQLVKTSICRLKKTPINAKALQKAGRLW